MRVIAEQDSSQAPNQGTAGRAPQHHRAAPPAEAALIAPRAAIREALSHPCPRTGEMKRLSRGPAGRLCGGPGRRRQLPPGEHQQTTLPPAPGKCQPKIRYGSGTYKSKLENAIMYF